jgi:hypothetical protein
MRCRMVSCWCGARLIRYCRPTRPPALWQAAPLLAFQQVFWASALASIFSLLVQQLLWNCDHHMSIAHETQWLLVCLQASTARQP